MKPYSLVAMSLFAILASSVQADDGHAHDHAKRDHLRATAQKICPVTGKKLGSMGAPIKVAVGEQKEEIFLCCKGCTQKQINPQHWATIHTNIAQAQGKCPVMQKPLPANPKWTITNGQVVYICCPPCSKKIAADPETFLGRVDTYLTASMKRDPSHQHK
ncbi:hypothetical protein [Thalassoglobus sp.]|uniref:hypothetical protein n=1 Tax=Thalassoglobus sp. TaxID=2795869 RepID=UPI003AA8AED0